jgi:hypothetical protein
MILPWCRILTGIDGPGPKLESFWKPGIGSDSTRLLINLASKGDRCLAVCLSSVSKE